MNSQSPTIFYHEDDFRQVEILPNENRTTLEAACKEIESRFSGNADGNGDSDVYVRNDNDKTFLNQRQIHPHDLEKIISSIGLERITTVLTGYGQNHRVPHNDCIAFGKDYTSVYYDFKDNVVQHIWLTDHWHMNREALTVMLYDLGMQWDLLLQDWNLGVTIDLKDWNSIEQYLQTYNKE